MPLSNSELGGLLCSRSRLRALNDQDLLVALRSNCNDALAVLFERHSPTVLQWTRAILPDDAAAEEIVREVFMDAFHTVSQFDPSEDFQLRLLQYAYWRVMNLGNDLQDSQLKELEVLEKEIIAGPFSKMLRDARIQRGLSLDEAVDAANAADINPTQLSRALGLAIKQSREERRISRRDLSRKTGLPLDKIVRLERGLAEPLPMTEFVRISCALGMRPLALDDRLTEIHENIHRVPRRKLRCRADRAPSK